MATKQPESSAYDPHHPVMPAQLAYQLTQPSNHPCGILLVSTEEPSYPEARATVQLMNGCGISPVTATRVGDSTRWIVSAEATLSQFEELCTAERRALRKSPTASGEKIFIVKRKPQA